MQYDVAVRTILDLDKRYNPFAIRADRGAGEYQIEILRKNLGDKVKGVFYGEKKEVRDPISNMIEKKSLKPLLINQMVLLLERGQLRIPHIDIEETIQRQMMNFRVTKVSTQSQEPIYTDVDEHALDGMIFAMTAFMDEYPNLIDIIEEAKFEQRMYVRNSIKQPDVMKDIDNQMRKGLDTTKETPQRYNKTTVGYGRRKAQPVNNLGWRDNKGLGNVWRNK